MNASPPLTDFLYQKRWVRPIAVAGPAMSVAALS
jgi:hypothetical protein